jgi:hypothetical protein
MLSINTDKKSYDALLSSIKSIIKNSKDNSIDFNWVVDRNIKCEGTTIDPFGIVIDTHTITITDKRLNKEKFDYGN